MAKSSDGLLAQIENGALDSSVPLADTLRKCVALGGRAGSTELRDWARRELDGYGPDDELPEYRTVGAMIAIDGATMHAIITGQQIAHSSLPEFAQEAIKEEVDLRFGVAQLEDMVNNSRKGFVRIQDAAMPDLARIMNHEAPYGNSISAVYWQVSANSVLGVLDRTRTALVSLVAEMRAAGLDSQQLPTPEAANQAVSVVLHNAKRSVINVTTSQSSGAAPATAIATVGGGNSSQSTRLPAWIRGPWGFLVGASTIVAGAVGVATWQGWNPL
ncbi:hypothetical protein [Knoellia sp. p5-6-4]|uniref:AbiTii domain-containing protein n=1 Tax=unclassified Knoellia TaxID=2618719 RepID=UPI0023D98F0F|nr:hypothetical protein [Knoellia sp. p5-6-4]MDF2146765.1 hypothetical protein [Knoellia sp. p5-6-4]